MGTEGVRWRGLWLHRYHSGVQRPELGGGHKPTGVGWDGAVQATSEGQDLAGSPQHLPSPSALLTPSLSAQILLISDYFYAFLRREYYLTHGLHLTAKDGTEAMLVLK